MLAKIYGIIATAVAATIGFQPAAAQGLVWPVGSSDTLEYHFGPCRDWPEATDGCTWLSATAEGDSVWRDSNRFQTRPMPEGSIPASVVGKYHLGADFNLGGGETDKGKPVRAIADGRIVKVVDVQEEPNNWGNVVFIEHDLPTGTYTSVYAHVDWGPDGKPQLGNVEKGKTIAVIGNGNGVWPYHLHFEIREGKDLDRGPGYTASKTDKGPQGQIDPVGFLTRQVSESTSPEEAAIPVFAGALKTIPSRNNRCSLKVGQTYGATFFEYASDCQESSFTGGGTLFLYSPSELIDIYYVGSEFGFGYDIRDGQIVEGFSKSEFSFTLQRCDQGISGYRSVRVVPTTRRAIEFFYQDALPRKVLAWGAEFAAQECPVPRKGLSNIVVELTDNQEVVTVRARNYVQDRLTWQEYNNKYSGKIKADISARNRAEKERRRREQAAIEAEQRRLALEKERAVVAQLKVDSEIEWSGKWEIALSSKAAWANTADLLRFDPAKTASILSDGHDIIFEIMEIEFANGNLVVHGDQRFTNIYEGIEKSATQKLQEEDFSWDNWMGAINEVSDRSPTGYSFACRVPPKEASGLKQGTRYVFKAKLLSMSNQHAQFDCKVGGPA